MFNDPEIMKMIIYVLAGLCGVLAIAVIFLGIKRNSYYVDEDGNEVPPPAKRKKRKNAEPEEEPEDEETDEEPEDEEVAGDAEEEPAPAVQETVVVPVMRHTEPAEEETDEEAEEEEKAEEDRGANDPVMGPLFSDTVAATGAEVTVTINGQSETHVLDTMPCMMGREARSCNLVLQEPAVSRRHARLFLQDNGLFVEDISEHNGRYVNGTKLVPLGQSRLNDGDEISLGRAVIRIDRILY